MTCIESHSKTQVLWSEKYKKKNNKKKQGIRNFNWGKREDNTEEEIRRVNNNRMFEKTQGINIL